MYTVRAMNQNNRRKDFVPVYIFIDCTTSLRHYNSINPRTASITHYHEEGEDTKRKQTFQWDMFFSATFQCSKLLQHVFQIQK